MSFKRFVYKTLSLSNDVNAIKKGKIGQRLARKQAYKSSNKLINKVFKKGKKW